MQLVSMDALHRSQGAKLQRFLLRLLGNSADAADAHQETYLRMLAALSRTSVENPSAFLFQVANNVALRMRNRQRLEGTLFHSVSDAEMSDIVDAYALPERQVMARQELRRLAADIDALPPRCREVFLLVRIDGHSNGEVATRLGISRNMVEKHLIKALLHCRSRSRERS
ncbi:sigma-70 family RNA polymerase sigma factor [Methylobacterium sp. SD274]|uniref:RNA polymerase sigma factor n=1 Tax=unclassified Methylobacterium TaxID=2615210 RepID=UPI0006FFCE3A|nr:MULTISPECIES: sigma-70 family RNA polymerase sigma factor [unclassified Methylobacterium]KQO49368.1 RNA polymerase subunit sigma-70 [Methylobacterium sp. Leaf86]KQP00405.1 RNA polymerase subunit sigma-70 [Methylobacterium sp. Leaf91]MBO1022384.1 sigma-70 family RNA polymerase sigma factor [Methylobacterium sp. SD274]